jgi:hypothetical protein
MQQGSGLLWLAYCFSRENPGDDDEEEEEVEEPSSSSEDDDGERGDDKEEADRRAGERPMGHWEAAAYLPQQVAYQALQVAYQAQQVAYQALQLGRGVSCAVSWTDIS